MIGVGDQFTAANRDARIKKKATDYQAKAGKKRAPKKRKEQGSPADAASPSPMNSDLEDVTGKLYSTQYKQKSSKGAQFN